MAQADHDPNLEEASGPGEEGARRRPITAPRQQPEARENVHWTDSGVASETIRGPVMPLP
jgi:hypothetical protein